MLQYCSRYVVHPLQGGLCKRANKPATRRTRLSSFLLGVHFADYRAQQQTVSAPVRPPPCLSARLPTRQIINTSYPWSEQKKEGFNKLCDEKNKTKQNETKRRIVLYFFYTPSMAKIKNECTSVREARMREGTGCRHQT